MIKIFYSVNIFAPSDNINRLFRTLHLYLSSFIFINDFRPDFVTFYQVNNMSLGK